jgi:hypothetical protein
VSDGAGAVNWSTVVGTTETMAQAFEAAATQADNVLTTSAAAANATLIIKQGPGAGSTLFEAQNENGAPTVKIGVEGINTNLMITEKAVVGEPGQTYTLPVARADAANQRLVSTGAGGVVEFQASSFANIYWHNNATLTPLPIQNTYDIMRGARLGTFANDFTLAIGPPNQQNLVYRGLQTKLFQITQCLTWRAESTRESYVQAVFLNNALIPGSEMVTILDDTNEYPRNATIVVIAELKEDDRLGGVVKCTSDTKGALIVDYQLSIVEV